MEGLDLVLLSLNGVAFEGKVERFCVPSYKGDMEVCPGYTPIVEELDPIGILKITQPSKKKYFLIFDGVLQHSKGRSIVLCSQAEDADDIDLERALASKKRAEERLSSHDENIDLTRASASLKRAVFRIKAKQLSSGKN